MATMTVCVNKRRKRKDGLYQVYIRVAHNGKNVMVKTDKVASAKGLNSRFEVTDPFVLKPLSAQIVEWLDRLNRYDISHWDVREVVDFLKQDGQEIIFSDYARRYIDEMINTGHERNAKNYFWALSHLERFVGTTKIRIEQLTVQTLQRWIETMSRTSRAKELYPVCIRQMFKAALMEYNDYDRGIIHIKINPWLKLKIRQADVPQQRAITAEEIRAFFAAPLPATVMINPKSEVGRDVAMMILCLAGMNAVDIFNLKKKDYYGGILHYNRAKTRRARRDDAYFEIRVPEIVKPLLEKWRAADDRPELLCFAQRYADHDSFNSNINAGIKDICRSLGMSKEESYTAYAFRHSWATTAQNDCGATIPEVGFGLNHTNGYTVTRGYIKPDFTPVWELNEKVIDFIFFSGKKSRKAQQQADDSQSAMFRITPKMLVRGLAFYAGQCLGSIEDIGYSNVDEVLARLYALVPDDVPQRAMVQFKIVNEDSGKVAVYEKMKGKGF